MSSILDALKKSEADRQRAAGPTLLDLRVQPRKRGLPAWAIALGILLVGNGALLAWLTLRHAPAATATPAPAAPQALAGAVAAPAVPGAPVAPGAPVTQAAQAASPALGGRTAQAVAPDAEGNPADEAPAIEAQPRPQRSGTGGAGLQSYSALSATLPPLHLDLHFWSEAPAERYALINLHRVAEGEALPEGPRVLEITREGVVMEYAGREFVLGRE